MHGQLGSAAAIRSVTHTVAMYGDGGLKLCFQHMGEVGPATALLGVSKMLGVLCVVIRFSASMGKQLACYYAVVCQPGEEKLVPTWSRLRPKPLGTLLCFPSSVYYTSTTGNEFC